MDSCLRIESDEIEYWRCFHFASAISLHFLLFICCLCVCNFHAGRRKSLWNANRIKTKNTNTRKVNKREKGEKIRMFYGKSREKCHEIPLKLLETGRKIKRKNLNWTRKTLWQEPKIKPHNFCCELIIKAGEMIREDFTFHQSELCVSYDRNSLLERQRGRERSTKFQKWNFRLLAPIVLVFAQAAVACRAISVHNMQRI